MTCLVSIYLLFEMESSNLMNDFKCEICEEIFSSSKSKTNHISNVHEEVKTCIKIIQKGKVYPKCNSCGKSFTRSGSLNLHIKTVHEGQRSYKCDSCGKSFTESGSLKQHIKTLHEGQRNYKCDSCGKYFSASGSLNRHIKAVHNG